MTRDEAEEEETARLAFQNVFFHGEGPEVLAWILNELGWFSTNAEKITPDYIAFANLLLLKCGINHPFNLKERIRAEITSANNDDLALIKEAKGEQEE